MAVVSQPSYEVREEEGSVTVCVELSGGTLDRPVFLNVFTEQLTALGRQYNYLIN